MTKNAGPMVTFEAPAQPSHQFAGCRAGWLPHVLACRQCQNILGTLHVRSPSAARLGSIVCCSTCNVCCARASNTHRSEVAPTQSQIMQNMQYLYRLLSNCDVSTHLQGGRSGSSSSAARQVSSTQEGATAASDRILCADRAQHHVQLGFDTRRLSTYTS
jgi:hypothetical protein